MGNSEPEWKIYNDRDFARLYSGFGHPVPLGRILAMIEAARCETVVAEKNPQETECKQEARLRHEMGLYLPRVGRPVRYHFFEGRIKGPHEVKDCDERYLGYCDVRSEPSGTISDALIDSRVFVQRSSNFLFLICQRRFEVRLAGRRLAVQAFPYMQQDARVCRCAEAAMSSLSKYLGKPRTAPAFARVARRLRGQPGWADSEGMWPEELEECIRRLGFNPIKRDYYSAERTPIGHAGPDQIVYRYLESGIPVLVGFQIGDQRHVMVVVGHTFNPDSWVAQAERLFTGPGDSGDGRHFSSTNWVERFIVQDDQLGPYTLLPASHIRLSGAGAHHKPVVIVPLDSEVRLDAELAEKFVSDFMKPEREDGFPRLLGKYLLDSAPEPGGVNEFWYRQFVDRAKDGKLVLRTSLWPSKEWKRHMRSWAGYSQLGTKLQRVTMPEKVWVVEISWPEIFLHTRRQCGEMVLSAHEAINPEVGWISHPWLWAHVPGVVAYRQGDDREKFGIETLDVDDSPRPHHVTLRDRARP